MDKKMALKALSRDRKTEPTAPWWSKQARERPLATVGTFISVVGGLILLGFFCQLGGMPELDLAGASAILMAVAIVGFALAAALAVSGIVAGLMMRDEEDVPVGLGEPRSLFLLAAPGTLSSIGLAAYWALDSKGNISSFGYSVPFVLLTLFACGFSLTKPAIAKDVKPERPWSRTRRGLAFWMFGYLWLLPAGGAVLTFYALFPRDGALWHMLIGMVGWTLWCYLSNVVIALVKKVKIAVLLVAYIAVSLFILLGITANWAGFPRAIVSALGLGEIPVKMVVTRAGCDYLNKMAADRVVCRMGSDDSTGVVCPAMLRSRIGSPFFIGLSPYEPTGRWPQLHPPQRMAAISIPKAEVPSWSQLSPAPAKAPLPAGSGAIVTYLDSEDHGQWLREQCGNSPSMPLPAQPAASTPAIQ